MKLEEFDKDVSSFLNLKVDGRQSLITGKIQFQTVAPDFSDGEVVRERRFCGTKEQMIQAQKIKSRKSRIDPEKSFDNSNIH